jgi:adenosylhomocysteine nucleosidase
MRILVTFAVEAEFAPWRRRHRFRRKEIVGSRHNGGSDTWYKCEADDVCLDVYLTGVGWRGSRAVLASLLKKKPDLCISSGLAGGLNPSLKSGEIVVAREVLLVNGGRKFTSRSLLVDLAEKTGAKPVRTFLTNTQVVCEAKSKQSMAAFGDVVEMESFHVLKSARDVQVPALSVRAISDAVDEDLPFDFGRAIGPGGRINYARLLLQVATHPRRLPAMISFGKKSEKAAQNLADFLDRYVGAIRQRFPLSGPEKDMEVAAR